MLKPAVMGLSKRYGSGKPNEEFLTRFPCRVRLDVGVLLEVDQAELLDPEDAVLEQAEAEAVALPDDHLPADDLVLGVVVAAGFEPVEVGALPLDDVEGDVQ